MKTLVFIFSFYLLSFFGKPNDLTGSWQWISSSGGFAGKTMTPLSANEQRSILISKSKICWFVNGNLTSETSYSFGTAKSIYTHEQVDVLRFENQPDLIFSISGDTLVLSNNFPDGLSHVYVRKSS